MATTETNRATSDVTGAATRRSAPRGGSTSEAVIKMWVIEYEHNGQCWRTVIEHYTREQAMARFQRDNPHVHLRECY